MIVKVEEIKEIIAQAGVNVNADGIETGLSLSDQGVDSLDLANILLLIEEKYSIKIPSEDMSKVQNIDAIVQYMAEK